MTKRILLALLRIAVSTAFSGLFYIGWMVVTISAFNSGCCILNKILLWIIAPFTVALGFTVGILLVDLIFRQQKTKFWLVYRYPLAGCIIGALVVVFFGPMLIVFGMFALGGISVIIREVKITKQRTAKIN